MPVEINRKKAPGSKQINFRINTEPRYFQLGNGIPVYIIDKGIQEVTCIELVFKAGTYYQDHYHAAKATNKLLTAGTKSYSAEDISECFEFYGSYIETNNSKDNAYIRLYTLNKYLNETLPMLAEVVMNPVFPDHETDIYRSTRKERLNIKRQNVNYLASTHFYEQIFGNTHPYGYILEPGHLDGLGRDILAEHHKNNYRADECTIIVSGKIPMQLDDLLEKTFGSFSGANSKNRTLNVPPINTSTEKKQFIHKKDAMQAALCIGKATINRLHPDYPELSIMNTVLGGYFGSRLMKNIREDKGYTYGISSALISFHHSGLFIIFSEVGNQVLEASIEEVYKEIRKLREEPVRQKELKLVKNFMMGALMRSMDGPFEIAKRLGVVLEYGQTLDTFNHFIKSLKGISPERIQELANKYLHEDSLFLTIAGNKEA